MNITRHQRIALCLSLLSLATTQCFEQASWKTRFIGDFFSWHGIHAITIQACPATDTLRFVKTLMLRNFWLVLKKHVGVAGYLSENHFKLGIFLEYDCDTSKQAFAEKSTTSYLRSDYQWLVWSQTHAFDSTHPDYNFDSDVTWATPNLHQGRVALFDAYKIDRLIVTPAGYWDSTRGITHRVKDQKYSSRSDLHGISFKAGIVVNVMPEDHIEDRLVSQTDRYTDSMARYHYALYTHLRDWFNFKMKLIVMDSYGYATANGSYNGLIGLLHSKEVELGISAVLIRHGRLKFVDYTAPTWLFWYNTSETKDLKS